MSELLFEMNMLKEDKEEAEMKLTNQKNEPAIPQLEKQVEDYFELMKHDSLRESSKEHLEEENRKRAEELSHLVKSMQEVKKSQVEYKDKIEKQIEEAFQKEKNLRMENIKLKQENENEAKNSKKAKEKLVTVEKKMKILEEQLKIVRDKKSKNEKTEGSIASDMLGNLLQFEKEANKYKYQSERLKEELIESKHRASTQLGIIYSIVYDFIEEKTN